jgi:hypothetical protein
VASSCSRITIAAVLATLTGVGVPAAWGAAPDADNAQLAAWTPKELRFVYQGFTTHYSCDGLREKVRSALLALGARQDLTVSESACSSPFGRPDPFPGVNIKMQVLTPLTASAAAPDAAAAAVAAHWKTVDLRLNRDALSDSGDCELLEQIKHSILPLFSTRHVEYSSNCVPHQLSAGGTVLRAQVLISDAPEKKPGTAAAAR